MNIVFHVTTPINDDPRPKRFYEFCSLRNKVTVNMYTKKNKSKINKVKNFLLFILKIDVRQNLINLINLQDNSVSNGDLRHDMHVIEDPMILPYLDDETLNNTILDLREYHPYVQKNLRYIFILRPIYNFIYKNYLAKCKKIVTVSRYQKNLLLKNFGIESTLIYSYPRKYEIQDFQNTKSPLRIVYYGLANKYRGLELIGDTIGSLNGVNLDLYLVGEQKYIEKMKKKFANFTNIRILPIVEEHKVTELLSSYHIGICLFWKSLNAKHSMPNKFFQYLQAGLCVIGLRNTEIGKFIETNQVGILLQRPRRKDLRRLIDSLNTRQIDQIRLQSMLKSKELNLDAQLVDLWRLFS